MLDQINRLCLAHFLCKFDPTSKKRKTRDVVREVALECYSKERVDEFLDDRLLRFQAALVEEFNARHANNTLLRFQIADSSGVGEWVAGYRSPKSVKEIAFQDTLHSIAAAEFEKLSAIVLGVIGCSEVFFTPQSHDQGVDAFGYQNVIDPIPYGATHHITWIVQAKHYAASSVNTGDVRELVGSKELLVSKVFSTVDQRYKQLTLRPYAPTAIVLVTTEEIPSTVRRLAEGAGIFVLAASDLYHILSPFLRSKTTSGLRGLIAKRGKSVPTLS